MTGAAIIATTESARPAILVPFLWPFRVSPIMARTSAATSSGHPTTPRSGTTASANPRMARMIEMRP
ncbi:hypothetical protein DSP71_12285, partial [Microbacterium sp. H6]